MEITNTGNETGQASMTGSCPPMGLCVDSSGNTFIANPTGSPALTALQVVMKTGLMASMAMIAGPLVAVYNIAVSHIQILSRLEMVSTPKGSRQSLLKSSFSGRGTPYDSKNDEWTKFHYTMMKSFPDHAAAF